MTSAEAHDLQTRLAALLGPSRVKRGTFESGEVVTVSAGGVSATGKIGPMSLHWHTMKGLNTYPVILDGTGVQVEVDSSALTKGKI